MPYDKTSWENYVTPLDENNMNHIEEGIENASNKSEQNEADITVVKQDIQSINEHITSLDTQVQSKISKQDVNIVNDISITVNGDQVEMTTSSASLKDDIITPSSDTTTIIPAATSTQSGLMTSSTVRAISEMQDDINHLKSRTSRLLYTASTSPTAEQINSFVVEQGYTKPFAGVAVVIDKTFHIWHFYDNTDTWQDDGLDTTSQFTNEYAGVIKGSTNDGQIYAEDDGTGSVVGWDTLKSNVNTNTEEINKRALQTDLDLTNDNVNTLDTRLSNDEVILSKTLQKSDIAPTVNSVVMVNTSNNQELKDVNTFLLAQTQTFDDSTKEVIRQNIGAGTSNFDSSYNSLSDKPIVNTTSSTSLTPDTEELNNLINLHKISKTGTSTDLTDSDDLVRQDELTSIQDELDSKLTTFEMIFNGSTITHESDVLSLDDIYRAIENTSLHIKLLYNLDIYNVMTYSQETIIFTNIYVDNNKTYTKVITVTNDDIVYQIISGAVEITLYNEKGQNTDGAMTQKATTDEFDRLDARINDLQYDTFPNAVRVGDLTINDGQVSGFTTSDYLMFPFILNVQNRPFQVDFCFTTGNDVTTQQNVLDSKFGIALAIKEGCGLMAISNNGINWASQGVGTINIQPNTTYYARLSWNRLVYKTQISTDGVNYVDDISITNATQPYPVTMFIGGGSVEALGHISTPFYYGSIDMNKAYLYVDNRLVWHGMIAASLETLADVSLSNIDEAGKQVIKDNAGTDVKVNNVKQSEIKFTSDPQTQLNHKVNSAIDGGWDDVQNSLVLSRTPYNKDRIYFNSRDFTPKIPVTSQVAGDITTYITVELNDTIARKTDIPTDYVTHEDAGTTQEGVPFYTKTESDERYGNYLTTWSGSATRNGDIISSGNCRYVVIGNVVIVNIEEVVFTSTAQAHDSVYFAGLPKAKTAPVITLTGWGSGVYQPRAYMDWTGTTLRNYWSGFTPSTSSRYTCTFMYIKE